VVERRALTASRKFCDCRTQASAAASIGRINFVSRAFASSSQSGQVQSPCHSFFAVASPNVARVTDSSTQLVHLPCGASCVHNMRSFMLERIFKLREHGMTVQAEVRAGIVTFLAMA